MNKLTTSILLTFVLISTGCSLLSVPSMYDPNESEGIINVVNESYQLDCKNPSVADLKESIQWMTLYTAAKGSSDVEKNITIMSVTASKLNDDMSEVYCGLKRKILIAMSEDTAESIMKRYAQ